MINFDVEAQRAARRIVLGFMDQPASEAENIVNKTLGVVQEHGVYAGFLFAMAKYPKNTPVLHPLFDLAVKINPNMVVEKKSQSIGSNAEHIFNNDPLGWLTENICNDLDFMLLTKQVWERCLVYVRFGLKARVS